MSAAVILFFDVTCPRAYDDRSLAGGVLGGTEGTLVRIAEGLAATRPVAVFQHARDEAYTSPAGVSYLPGDVALLPAAPVHVVLLRNPGFGPFLRRRFPDARTWLWLHDHPGRRLPACRWMVVESGAELITVSRYHQRITEAAVPGVTVRTLYNPIDEGLVPDGRPVDPHRLVFLSARERGLAEAVAIVARLRAFAPFELHVIGRRGPEGAIVAPGVVDHGPLPHHEAVSHLQGALCLFYPNVAHAETFGLVMAEANAVGTPVLAHGFGAAREVTSHPDEVLDARDVDAVIARVLAWSQGARPVVTVRPAFRRDAVLAAWRGALA